MKDLPKDIQARMDYWYREMKKLERELLYLAQAFSALEADIDVWKRNTNES